MTSISQLLRRCLLGAAGIALVAWFPLSGPHAILVAQGQGRQRPSMANTPDNPLLQGFRWRAIGPIAQGARIDDIEGDETNPSTYYIGYAVSGL